MLSSGIKPERLGATLHKPTQLVMLSSGIKRERLGATPRAANRGTDLMGPTRLGWHTAARPADPRQPA
jgi:hypothetical protein